MTDATPRRRIAVVTCMDARIDALAILGLSLGDAHVIRNAGGRVTDDVVRSLGLSVDGFGTSTIIVMEHTECGADIDDHPAALRQDIDVLVASPELEDVVVFAGVLYDVDDVSLTDVVLAERSNGSSRHQAEATPTKHEYATLQR